MSQAQQLPSRSELPQELTWDLEKIFVDLAAFDEAYQELQTKLIEGEQFKGALGQSAE